MRCCSLGLLLALLLHVALARRRNAQGEADFGGLDEDGLDPAAFREAYRDAKSAKKRRGKEWRRAQDKGAEEDTDFDSSEAMTIFAILLGITHLVLAAVTVPLMIWSCLYGTLAFALFDFPSFLYRKVLGTSLEDEKDGGEPAKNLATKKNQ